MSVIARLKYLEAIKIVDSPEGPAGQPSGSDLITLRADMDTGDFDNATQGMSKGEKMLFEFYPEIQELRFDAEVKLLLYHYSNFLGRQYIIGERFIAAGEAGLGERKQQFTGSGAHYELTYDVVRASV